MQDYNETASKLVYTHTREQVYEQLCLTKVLKPRALKHVKEALKDNLFWARFVGYVTQQNFVSHGVANDFKEYMSLYDIFC